MILNKKLPNGFEYIDIENDIASAKIALQGAHIFHYNRKDEDDILWISNSSDFEYGKAIRGGVPLCWPSFGMQNKNLPQHGFARTSMFELVESKEIDSKTTQIILKLQDSKDSFSLWPYHFELILKVTVSDKLTMELTTTNMDDKPFELTQALHSYFSVSHISNIEVKGLENKPYFDALTDEECIQNKKIIFTGEFDRVYQEVDSVISLVDETRVIKIQNEGSSSLVVWNPWIDKCARMSAMENDSYKSFVCIESANAFDDFKVLHPLESHTLKATIY